MGAFLENKKGKSTLKVGTEFHIPEVPVSDVLHEIKRRICYYKFKIALISLENTTLYLFLGEKGGLISGTNKYAILWNSKR